MLPRNCCTPIPGMVRCLWKPRRSSCSRSAVRQKSGGTPKICENWLDSLPCTMKMSQPPKMNGWHHMWSYPRTTTRLNTHGETRTRLIDFDGNTTTIPPKRFWSKYNINDKPACSVPVLANIQSQRHPQRTGNVEGNVIRKNPTICKWPAVLGSP